MTEPRRPRRGGRGPRKPRPDAESMSEPNPYREDGGGDAPDSAPAATHADAPVEFERPRRSQPESGSDGGNSGGDSGGGDDRSGPASGGADSASDTGSTAPQLNGSGDGGAQNNGGGGFQ